MFKKGIAILLVLLLLIGGIPVASAGAFSGNFEPISFYIGTGSYEKLLEGITAQDPSTHADITANIQILGTVDFNRVGVYTVQYHVQDSKDQSWGELRKVTIVDQDKDVVYSNINNGFNFLESIDFQKIANTAFNLSYDLYSEGYKKMLYSWTFSGKDLHESPRRLSVTISSISEHSEAIQAGVGQANFQILNFEHKGKFPAPAEILFAVDPSFDSDTTLYLYAYGSGEGFKLVADGIAINVAGYAEHTFLEGGDYVLTDKKVGFNQNPMENLPTSSDSATILSPKPDNQTTVFEEGFNNHESMAVLVSGQINSPNARLWWMVMPSLVFAVSIVALLVYRTASKKKKS